jgi:hypothetical protein
MECWTSKEDGLYSLFSLCQELRLVGRQPPAGSTVSMWDKVCLSESYVTEKRYGNDEVYACKLKWVN